MKRCLGAGVTILVIILIILLFFKPQSSCYAPPRDINTILPYVENFTYQYMDSENQKILVDQDSQMDVFKDASGTLNQREHPLTNFFQANAYSKGDLGGFSSLESSAGTGMYLIPQEEQYTYYYQYPENTDACPRRQVTALDDQGEPTSNVFNGVGVYPIDATMRNFQVYGPLDVTASGPNGRARFSYPATAGCQPKFTLTLDQPYDTLELTSNVTACTRSAAVVYGQTDILEPGTYPLNSSMYQLTIYPPLKVTATGDNPRVEIFNTTAECPTPVILALEKEKTYTSLILSTDLTPPETNNVSFVPPLDDYLPGYRSRIIPLIGSVL